LVQSTGRLPPGEGSRQAIRARFHERLRGEGLDDVRIDQTMQSVNLGTMLGVVRGEEPLEIRLASELERPDHGINLDQQVVLLSAEPLQFRAGERATIAISGPLSDAQRQQVKLLCDLLQTVLHDSGDHSSPGRLHGR